MAAFARGELTLDHVQAALQTTLGLLENDGTGVAKVVRLAEADIEKIRFTRLLDEQRSAITFRLDEMVKGLPAERS